MEYNEVLNKIVDIIKQSNEIEKEYNLKKLEVQDDFAYIIGFKIHKDLAKEFRNLLNEESKLFVSQLSSEESRELSQKIIDLNTGISPLLVDNNPDVVRNRLSFTRELSREQYKRITNFMYESKITSVPKKESITIDTTNLKNEEVNKKLNCDYKELVFLGMCGELTLNMISELKHLLNDEEYYNLLNTLYHYKIFSKEELLKARDEGITNLKVINDIDELVAFLAIRKDLNIKALKGLIPVIGVTNYHYLIDQLFKYNAIDFDVYREYLEDFKFI